MLSIQQKVGKDNVSPLGFGLMGMAHYRPKENETAESVEKQHFEILTRAADSGITFWDTADVYGPFANEEMVGKWFKATGRRKEIFLCTKFGNILDKATFTMTIRGDAQYVKECCEASLKRLNTDYIDLYYQHRVDPKVRIEETVSAMAELVKEGKVKYLGLSECSSNTLRRAHKVHPIAAVQFEYSLFSLDIERQEIGLKKTCDELGITIVAYSPLGRGLLTGQIQSRKDLEGDVRLMFPRFSEENFDNNIKLVHKVQEFAKKKGCTPGQLALAWLMKQGNVIPIPGTRRLKNFEENSGSLKVDLTQQEVDEIREVAEKAEVKGERYPERFMSSTFFESI